MKNIIILLIFFQIYSTSQSQQVITTNVSNLNSCDGSATFLDTNIATAWVWKDLTNNISFGDNMATVNNLCAGNYLLIYISNNSDSLTISFEISSNNCNNFYVENITTPASGINICDGTVEFFPFNDSTPIVNTVNYYINGINYSQNFINNLCPNNYSCTAIDSNSCTYTFSFEIPLIQDTTINLTANVLVTNVSESEICNGSVEYQINGGISPYTITNSMGVQVGLFEENLCEGIYTSTITDAGGSQITLTFIVASPEQIINNNFFPDSTIIGTINNGLIENCNIEFNSIDTAYLSNIEIISMDSIIVTWNIFDINGLTQIIESYSLNYGFGVYQMILEIFCPQRSQQDYLIIKEQFKLSNLSNSIYEEKDSKVSIYPNPFNNILNIYSEFNTNTTIQVTDIQGRIIYSDILQNLLLTVPSNDWKIGTYFIRIQNEYVNETRKLIKN